MRGSHAAPLNRRSVVFWLLAAALPFFVLPATPPTSPWGASNEVLALGSTSVVFAVVALSMGFFIRWTGLPTVATPGLWGIGAYAAALPDMPRHGEGIQAYFHGVAAEACVQTRDLGRARLLVDEAMAVLKKTPPTSYFSVPGLISGAHVYLALHRLRADPGGLAGASAMSKWLTSMAGMYPYATPGSLRVTGEVQVARGKVPAAVRQFKKAVDSAKQLAMPIEEGLAHLALSRHGASAERAAHAAEGQRLLARAGACDWYVADS